MGVLDVTLGILKVRGCGRQYAPHPFCHIQPGSIFGFNEDESTVSHRYELAKGTMSFKGDGRVFLFIQEPELLRSDQ